MAGEVSLGALAARAAQMVEAGLLDEVRGLLSRGYGPALPALQGIGYRQFVEVALGRLDGRSALEQMKRDTVRYAKRQVTWFTREPDVEWIDRIDYSVDANRRDSFIPAAQLIWPGLDPARMAPGCAIVQPNNG